MSYDSKPRVGVLVPSSNTVMERDLKQQLDDVADIHAARMYLVETTAKAEAEMLDIYLPQAIADLASLKPAVTVFGCTSAGALRGPDYDRELCARIAEETCGAVVSTIGSVGQAITASGKTRVAVLTPYLDELNEKIRASLESDGLEVQAIEGFGISDNFGLAEPTPNEIAKRAIALIERTQPEQLFVSCTNFRSLEAVGAIEDATGVPVMTSNRAVTAAVRRVLEGAAEAQETGA